MRTLLIWSLLAASACAQSPTRVPISSGGTGQTTTSGIYNVLVRPALSGSTGINYNSSTGVFVNNGVISITTDASGRLVLSNTSGDITLSSVLTASSGIDITGTTILNTGARSLAIGGVGLSVSSATGAITLTNTGVTSATFGGAGLQLSGTTGALTFTNSGVTSLTFGGSGLQLSNTNGAVTITNVGGAGGVESFTTGTPNLLVLSTTTGAITGSVVIVGGAGINISGTTIANTGALSFTVDASGRLALSGTTGAITLSSVLTASTGIGITGTTILNTGAQSLAIGGAGLSISSATGAITLTNTGVTSATFGGAGLSLSGTNGALTFTNSGVTSLTFGGSGLQLSNTNGAITITATAGAGGVTSLTIAGTGLAISTTTGAITLTGSAASRFPLVTTVTDTTFITPNSDSSDIVYQANTQATGTLTINADSGAPSNGQKLLIKIKSTNVQAFAWNSQYVSGSGNATVTLPSSTTGGSKIDLFGFYYDAVNSKWQITGAATGY